MTPTEVWFTNTEQTAQTQLCIGTIFTLERLQQNFQIWDKANAYVVHDIKHTVMGHDICIIFNELSFFCFFPGENFSIFIHGQSLKSFTIVNH